MNYFTKHLLIVVGDILNVEYVLIVA